jgi:hypothetical protein
MPCSWKSWVGEILFSLFTISSKHKRVPWLLVLLVSLQKNGTTLPFGPIDVWTKQHHNWKVRDDPSAFMAGVSMEGVASAAD